MKILKNRIFLVILTAIIFTGVGIYAETKINADKISYTKTDGTETNVNSALNDLYTEANKNINDYLGTPTYYEDYGAADLQRTLSKPVSKGKYLALISEGQSWKYNSEVYGALNANANISCTSNNCTISKIAGKFIRVPNETSQMVVNNKYYLYYIEVKDNTDTISIVQGSTSATTNNPQYLNLTLIPVNK